MRLLLILRKLYDPLLYCLARLILYRGKLEDKWSRIKGLSEQDFFDVIDKYHYLQDPLWGAWDFTSRNPNLFFSEKPEFPWMKERKWGRDCDDWAHLIFLWAKHHGYPAWKVAIWNGFCGGGHMTCIYFKDGKYVLADYRIRGRKDSFEEALELFRDGGWLAYGKYDKLSWKIV